MAMYINVHKKCTKSQKSLETDGKNKAKFSNFSFRLKVAQNHL